MQEIYMNYFVVLTGRSFFLSASDSFASQLSQALPASACVTAQLLRPTQGLNIMFHSVVGRCLTRITALLICVTLTESESVQFGL